MATPQQNVMLATESLRDEIVRRRQQMQQLHRLQQENNAKKQTQESTTQTEGSGPVLTHLAVSILGMQSTISTSHTSQVEVVETPEPSPLPRATRRAQSHYNAFQTVCTSATDNPPSYASAIRHRSAQRRYHDDDRGVLPKYTCTVLAEAKLLLNLESVNPLHTATEGEWREMYVVVRGTMLNLYRVKDDGPGRFVRSYTLQHAEVGLATDASHTVLVPQSRLAHFIPSAARHRAWKKDPHLFRPERQTILRLRVETDQFLLADSNEERIWRIINAISAGIDIAPSLDERSVPKQCTVPRRRRRPRPQFNGDITDQTVIAEQERILQQMYPTFAEPAEGLAVDPSAPVPVMNNEPLASPSREEDEIDFSAIREDDNSSSTDNNILTPSPTNSSTSTSTSSTFTSTMLYASPLTNFTSDGKWRPPHTRTAAQIQRYTRRCMPLMAADSVRASDVLICEGKRVKINWRLEMLEDWSLQPPAYHGHDWKGGDKRSAKSRLVRSESSASGISVSRGGGTPASESREDVDTVDEIGPVGPGLAELNLSKTRTEEKAPSFGKGKGKAVVGATAEQQSQAAQAKAREVGREREGLLELQGAVYCF